MTWKIEFDNRARKELRKLNPDVQEKIFQWIRNNLTETNNPRHSGSPLKGRMKGLWRYRTGEYRIVCQIREEDFAILVLRIAHRRDIYDR